MEHLRDSGFLDISHYLSAQSQELKTLQAELAKLSTAYRDIETLPPPSLTAESSTAETETFAVTETQASSARHSPVRRERSVNLLSSDLSRELKDVFTRYVSCQNCGESQKIELAQFHQFMKDSGLTPRLLSQSKADVLFFQGNTGRSISFSRWVNLLAEVAKQRYRSSSAVSCLSRLVVEVILPAPAVKDKALPLLAWNLAITKLPSNLGRSVFDCIFQSFRSHDPNAQAGLTLNNYLLFVSGRHIVPELVSKRMAVRVFRAAQGDSFSDCVDSSEFYRVCCFLSFAAFPQRTSDHSVSDFLRWLTISAEKAPN